jgi:hypothetical protein
MYKNVVSAVLAINGLVLAAIGVGIAWSAHSQLLEAGLDQSQISRVAPTFCGLGLADASSSFFSFFAATLVFRRRAAGRSLALIVATTQLVVGIGLFLLSGVPLALYFIAMRGAIIGLLAWRLPTGYESPSPSAV